MQCIVVDWRIFYFDCSPLVTRQSRITESEQVLTLTTSINVNYSKVKLKACSMKNRVLVVTSYLDGGIKKCYVT